MLKKCYTPRTVFLSCSKDLQHVFSIVKIVQTDKPCYAGAPVICSRKRKCRSKQIAPKRTENHTTAKFPRTQNDSRAEGLQGNIQMCFFHKLKLKIHSWITTTISWQQERSKHLQNLFYTHLSQQLFNCTITLLAHFGQIQKSYE